MERVLLVCSAEQACKLLCKLLGAAGYSNISAVHSGSEGAGGRWSTTMTSSSSTPLCRMNSGTIWRCTARSPARRHSAAGQKRSGG